MYICPCHSLTSSQLPLPPPRVLKSILHVCVFMGCIFKQTLIGEKGGGGRGRALPWSSPEPHRKPPRSSGPYYSECGLWATWGHPELVRDAESWAPPLSTSITVCNLPRSPGDSSVHLRNSRLKLCKALLENWSRAYLNDLIKTVPITRFKSCLVSPKPIPKCDIVDVYCENWS